MPRREIREELRALLPSRGVLAGGGGFVTVSWRVVVDFENGSLTRARGDVGQPITDAMVPSKPIRLPGHVVSRIEASCIRLLDHDRTLQPVLTADAMGALIVGDGDRTWQCTPAGPITEGPAADLLAELHDLAWPEVPKGGSGSGDPP